MIKLNHLNLVVANVASAITLFETYFRFKCIDIKGDHIIAILKGADQFTLVIMSEKGDQTPVYPDAFHIGFMLESEEEVIQLHEQLKTGGMDVDQAPKKIRDSFGFYFKFEKILIEVGHYLS